MDYTSYPDALLVRLADAGDGAAVSELMARGPVVALEREWNFLTTRYGSSVRSSISSPPTPI